MIVRFVECRKRNWKHILVRAVGLGWPRRAYRVAGREVAELYSLVLLVLLLLLMLQEHGDCRSRLMLYGELPPFGARIVLK